MSAHTRQILRGAVGAALMLASAAVAAADTLRVPQDHRTIQAAVDTAAPGDTVLVHRGQYDENVEIRTPGISIVGRGRPVLTSFTSQSTILVDGVVHVSLQGLVVRDSSGPGIEFRGAADGRVTACSVIFTEFVGIWIESSPRTIVRRCRLSATTGVLVRDAERVEVRECRFESRFGHAVDAENCDELLLSRNRVIGSNDEGDGFEASGERMVIRDNRFLNCDIAIAVDGDQNHVLRNRMRTPFARAIRVRGDANVLEGNFAVNPFDEGVEVDGDDNTVRRNRIVRSTNTAFTFDGTGGTFERNVATRPGLFGFLVRTTSAELTRNVSARSGDTGVRVDGTGNTFTRNLAVGSRLVDLEDRTTAGSNTFTGNRFPRRESTP